MHKLHYTIEIAAPAKTVWHAMLDDATYRDWTTAFVDGSHYEGSWDEGSIIQFLNPNKEGMHAVIAENRPYEFVSIKHIGTVAQGVVDTDSDEVKQWSPSYENYTLKESNDVTTVSVELDSTPEYDDMFNEKWPKALARLKEIAEQT